MAAPKPALATTSVPLDTLEKWPGNARRGIVAGIKESMRVNGVFQPLIVQKSTNRIIAGNHRYDALVELHEEEPEKWGDRADVIVLDVNDARALKMNLADNKTSDDASWDNRALMDQLESVLTDGGDLNGTGFAMDEFDDLAASLIEDNGLETFTDPDDAPPPGESDFLSKEGDVWILGSHRLLVGSATDFTAVSDKLMKEELADCIWTDPPYGVEYVGRTADALTIQNDGADGLEALLQESFATASAVTKRGAPVYVAHSDTRRITFETSMRESGMLVRQNLIWVKNALVMGRSDYHYKHEPILEGENAGGGGGGVPGVEETIDPSGESGLDWVDQLEHDPVLYGFTANGEGRLGRGGDRWFGDNAQTTVFQVSKPVASRDHPTMKPVELIQAMIRNSCPPGGVILDLFAGSGSTLFAAHGLGMRARLVELDPRYADVICRRFQEHTGETPVLESSGTPVSFADEPVG